MFYPTKPNPATVKLDRRHRFVRNLTKGRAVRLAAGIADGSVDLKLTDATVARLLGITPGYLCNHRRRTGAA